MILVCNLILDDLSKWGYNTFI